MNEGSSDINIKSKNKKLYLGSSDLFAVTIYERDPLSKKPYS
tara:strand:- start:684 stop:809 length:126 start_codon:yes stop_codon:yes gene_type:complete